MEAFMSRHGMPGEIAWKAFLAPGGSETAAL
jgi:hypothetical protein